MAQKRLLRFRCNHEEYLFGFGISFWSGCVEYTSEFLQTTCFFSNYALLFAHKNWKVQIKEEGLFETVRDEAQ